MRVNLKFILRWAIAAAILLFYFLSVVQFLWFDSMLKGGWAWAAYLIAAVVASFKAGIVKGVIPTIEVVKKTATAEKKYRRAVIGFYAWFAICIFIYLGILFIHQQEL